MVCNKTTVTSLWKSAHLIKATFLYPYQIACRTVKFEVSQRRVGVVLLKQVRGKELDTF